MRRNSGARYCRVCGRRLKSAESVARGMGPVCAGRVIGVVSRIEAAKPPKAESGAEAVDLLGLGDGGDG